MPTTHLGHHPTRLWGSRCSSASSAIILAIILALLGALARLSKNPVAYGVSGFYTSFFRGTPLIVQIFLIYFGARRRSA